MKRLNIFRTISTAVIMLAMLGCSSDPDVIPVIPEEEIPEVESLYASASMSTPKATSSNTITLTAKDPQVFSTLSEEDAEKCVGDFEVVVVDPDQILNGTSNGRYTPESISIEDVKGTNTMTITLAEAPIAKDFTVTLNYTPTSGVKIFTTETVQESELVDPVVTTYAMSTSKLSVATYYDTLTTYNPDEVAVWSVATYSQNVDLSSFELIAGYGAGLTSGSVSEAEDLNYYKGSVAGSGDLALIDYKDQCQSENSPVKDLYLSSNWRISGDKGSGVSTTTVDGNESLLVGIKDGVDAENYVSLDEFTNGTSAIVSMRSTFNKSVAYYQNGNLMFAQTVNPDAEELVYQIDKKFNINIYPDIDELETLIDAEVYEDAAKQQKMECVEGKDYYEVELGQVCYLADITPTFATEWKWDQPTTTHSIYLNSATTNYASISFNELSSDNKDLVEIALSVGDSDGDGDGRVVKTKEQIAKFYVVQPAGVSLFTAAVKSDTEITVTPVSASGEELPTATQDEITSLSSSYREGFYLTIPYKTYIESWLIDPDSFTLRSSGVALSSDKKSIDVTFAQGIYTTDFDGTFTITYDGCSTNAFNGSLESGYVDMVVNSNDDTLLLGVPVDIDDNSVTLKAAPNISFSLTNKNSVVKKLSEIGSSDVTILLEDSELAVDYDLILTPDITNSSMTSDVTWQMNSDDAEALSAAKIYTFTPNVDSENILTVSGISYRPSDYFDQEYDQLTRKFTLSKTQRINFFAKNFTASEVPLYTDINSENEIDIAAGQEGSEENPFLLSISQGDAIYIPVTAIGVSMECILDEAYAESVIFDNNMVNADGFQVVYIKPISGTEVKFHIKSVREALTDTFTGDSVDAVDGVLYYAVTVVAAPLKVTPSYSSPTSIEILLDPGVQFLDSKQSFNISDFAVSYIADEGGTVVSTSDTATGTLAVSKVAVSTDSSTNASKVTLTLSGGTTNQMYSGETIMVAYNGASAETNDSYGRGFVGETDPWRFTELVPYYDMALASGYELFDMNGSTFKSAYAASGVITISNSFIEGMWSMTKSNYIDSNELTFGADPFDGSTDNVLYVKLKEVKSTMRRIFFEPVFKFATGDYRVTYDLILNSDDTLEASVTPVSSFPSLFLNDSPTAKATTDYLYAGAVNSEIAYDKSYKETWRTVSYDIPLTDTETAGKTVSARFMINLGGAYDLYFKNFKLEQKTVRPTAE